MSLTFPSLPLIIFRMDDFTVNKLSSKKFTVEVPASKSILIRALILSALTPGDTFLASGELCGDVRALLFSLDALGVRTEKCEGGLLVHGTREIARRAAIDVESSGAAARFLTACLAFFGGDFEVNASAQMRGRPMEIISILKQCGVKFDFSEEEGRLPFRMHSDGVAAHALTCPTQISTQDASGLMLAGAVSGRPLSVVLSDGEEHSPYLTMTAKLIEMFGGACNRVGNTYNVGPIENKPNEIGIEPDVSAACYFFAAALLLRAAVTVRKIKRESVQGDIAFLSYLQERGVRIEETEEGLTADATGVGEYRGFCEDMRSLSDQALTVAALAPFATTPTRITGLSRLRYQESDRLAAVCENLQRLGIKCTVREDGFTILPGRPRPAHLSSFGDHRVAMAFTLIGLKTGGVTIGEAACTRKSFEGFFPLISALTKG